jgi:hypothetical protein
MKNNICFILAACIVFSLHAQEIDTTKREVVFSYAERDQYNIDELLESIKEEPLGEIKGSSVALTEAQALAVFKKITTKTVLPGVASSEADLRVAAVGALAEDIEVSQALLLEAEKIKKNDPATRISMAGILISKGFPREALALLGTTQPSETLKLPGDRSIAAAWNLARGVAFVVTRNPQQAIPLLKKAIQQDEFLKEASQTLAKAQLMVGDANGARQTLKQGAWRQRKHISWSKDGYGVVPYSKIYDLNRGRYRALEEITTPNDSRKLKAFYSRLEELNNKINENLMKATTEFGAANAKFTSEPDKHIDSWTAGRLSQIAGHSSEVIGNTMGITILNTQWDPIDPPEFMYIDNKNDYTEDIEKLRMRDGALSIKQSHMINGMLAYMDFVPHNRTLFQKTFKEVWMKLPTSFKSVEEEIRIKCQAKIALNDRFLPAINSNMIQWDEAAKDWYKTAYRLSSGIAEHLPYGNEFESAKAYLEYTTWTIEFFRLKNWGIAYSCLAPLEGCEKYTGNSVPIPQKSEAEKKLEACNAFTSGISVKFKIQKPNKATLVEVSASCEKISVKTDIAQIVPGVVSVKAGVEWGPGKSGNGELTGLIGVSGKITDAISGDINIYTTVDMVTGETNSGIKGNISGKEGLSESTSSIGKTTVDLVGKAGVPDAVVYVATGMRK